jgi:hypothetical protein
MLMIYRKQYAGRLPETIKKPYRGGGWFMMP